jgi:hypothetical protein
MYPWMLCGTIRPNHSRNLYAFKCLVTIATDVTLRRACCVVMDYAVRQSVGWRWGWCVALLYGDICGGTMIILNDNLFHRISWHVIFVFSVLRIYKHIHTYIHTYTPCFKSIYSEHFTLFNNVYERISWGNIRVQLMRNMFVNVCVDQW